MLILKGSAPDASLDRIVLCLKHLPEEKRTFSISSRWRTDANVVPGMVPLKRACRFRALLYGPGRFRSDTIFPPSSLAVVTLYGIGFPNEKNEMVCFLERYTR